ncbi:MAG TPA: BPSS1780 family membrane protein [Burkholderiales bacterium]|nr:BPSS1780 family membrane protein [Burkholderiales bacterium]
MQIQSVGPGRGWHWLAGGFALFARTPLVWLGLVAVAALVAFLLSLLDRIGPLLLSLLVPGLMAGLLMGCRELERGGRLRIAHLGAGFLYRGPRLVAIGGLYLVGTMLIGELMIVAGGDALVRLLEAAQQPSPNPEELQVLLGQAAPAVFSGMGLFLLLLMGTWYAPPLVVFHDAGLREALRLSLVGCFRNILPMLIYGAITYLLSGVTAWLLGTLGLLVLIPVLLPSSYTSYKDIFEGSGAPAAEPGASEA